MFNLAWPWFLAALPLPWLLRWLVPHAASAERASLRVPFFATSREWELDTPGPSRKRFRATLIYVIWLGLVCAAARPQWVGDPLTMPVTGRDIFLAIDLSGSMNTQDQVLDGKVADRLAAVKKVAGDFIERRVGDRVGVILFGTKPYVQVPLTFDRTLAQDLLDDASIGLAGNETAIGEAIGLAVSELRSRPAQSRVVVLLTDGENTAGQVKPLEAGQLAAFYNIRVHTIGLVSSASEGDLAQTRLDKIDERTLQDIARTTGGAYLRARDTDGLQAVYGLLDDLEPAADHDDIVRPTQELYYWPLMLSYLLGLAMAAYLVLLSYLPDDPATLLLARIKSLREPLPEELRNG